MHLFCPVIILSSTLSLVTNLDTSYSPIVLSPTLNQPIENLSEKQTKQLLDKMFIDTVKEEMNNKN